MFGLGVLTYTLMTTMGALIEFDSKAAVIPVSAAFFFGVMAMALIGPTLATLARSKIASGTKQQVCVTTAAIVGFAMAAVADGWSSGIIEAGFKEHATTSKDLLDAASKLEQTTTIRLIDALVGSLIYFWLSGGIAFIRYWREPIKMVAFNSAQELSAVKADKHAAEARLSMLQAQIEPHFLFNSLASVKSVLRENPELAESTINDLVDYLRSSIPRFNGSDQVQQVTLEEQINLCEKYLKVMQLRMGNRLTYEVEIRDDVGSRPFPPLIVVSLVENAIKHGLEPKTEGGHTAIHAHQQGQDILVTVEDSGIGLLGDSNTLSTGLGLENIRNQLHVLYADKAKLELTGNEQGGVTASLRIPTH